MAKKEKYDDKDKAYAAERNKLIPEAERYANKRCGKNPPKGTTAVRETWGTKWNKIFFKRMERLYDEKVPCLTCGRKGKR